MQNIDTLVLRTIKSMSDWKLTPTVQGIMASTGFSHKTVLAAIERLTKNGLIEKSNSSFKASDLAY